MASRPGSGQGSSASTPWPGVWSHKQLPATGERRRPRSQSTLPTGARGLWLPDTCGASLWAAVGARTHEGWSPPPASCQRPPGTSSSPKCPLATVRLLTSIEELSSPPLCKPPPNLEYPDPGRAEGGAVAPGLQSSRPRATYPGRCLPEGWVAEERKHTVSVTGERVRAAGPEGGCSRRCIRGPVSPLRPHWCQRPGLAQTQLPPPAAAPAAPQQPRKPAVASSQGSCAAPDIPTRDLHAGAEADRSGSTSISENPTEAKRSHPSR